MQRSLPLATPLARAQIFVRVQDHSAFRQDSQLVAALPRDGKDIRLLINGAASPTRSLPAALVVAGPLSPMYLPGRRPTAHDVSPRSCPCRQRDRGGHAVGPVAPRAVLHWPRGSAVHAPPLECAERRSQPAQPHLPCCRTVAQLTLGRARRRCISLPGEVDPDKSDYLRGIMVITGEWTGLDWCVRICPALKAPTRPWQLVP